MYELHFSDEAKLDIAKLKQSEPKSYAKTTKLLVELQEHPTTGTGHPEKLSGNRAGQWSRRISTKHRLVYEIHEKKYMCGFYLHENIMTINNTEK